MQCPRCNTEMKFFSGVSKKTNKPYKMNKCQACNHVEWVRDEQQYGVAQNNQANVPAKQASKSVEQIMEKLNKIEDMVVKILQKTTGEIKYSETDMNPDKDLDIPF